MSLIDVRNKFDQTIDSIFKDKPIFISFLKKHERKELVLKNLCEEIVKCERYSLSFNANKYNTVITEVVKMFATNAIKHAEEKLISQAEITRRQKASDTIKNAEETMLILEKEFKDEQDKIKVFVNEHG